MYVCNKFNHHFAAIFNPRASTRKSVYDKLQFLTISILF